MTRIRWTTEAGDQLEGIVQHILKDNPEAARKIARAILDRIENLRHFPRLGATNSAGSSLMDAGASRYSSFSPALRATRMFIPEDAPVCPLSHIPVFH